jgi:hypothetical protein
MAGENLKLWDSVQKTDPKQTKKAKIGMMNITAICPQYQRKNATDKFGPYGIGWGVNDEIWTMETYGSDEMCRYNATFWYILDDKPGEFPICSNIKAAYVTDRGKGYLKVDDEYAKKAQTNAMTKGLSMLGFNSDVFEGLHDDSKYVSELNAELNPPTPPTPPPEPTPHQRLQEAIVKQGLVFGEWCKGQELKDMLAFKSLSENACVDYMMKVENGEYNA